MIDMMGFGLTCKWHFCRIAGIMTIRGPLGMCLAGGVVVGINACFRSGIGLVTSGGGMRTCAVLRLVVSGSSSLKSISDWLHIKSQITQ